MITHLICANGRFWSELKRFDFPSEDDVLARVIGGLDGVRDFSLLLWKLPTGQRLVDVTPEDEADEYMQCAGSATALTIEVRRRIGDEFVRSTVGRPRNGAAESVEVSWAGHTESIWSTELFDATEALGLFSHYRQTNSVPDGYDLRAAAEHVVQE